MTYDENEQLGIIGTKSREEQTIIKEKPRSSSSADRVRKLWEKKARIYRKDLIEIGYGYSTTELGRRMKNEILRTSGKPGTPAYKQWREKNLYVLPEWEPITPGSRKKGWRPHLMLEYLIQIGFLD